MSVPYHPDKDLPFPFARMMEHETYPHTILVWCQGWTPDLFNHLVHDDNFRRDFQLWFEKIYRVQVLHLKYNPDDGYFLLSLSCDDSFMLKLCERIEQERILFVKHWNENVPDHPPASG